MSSAEVADASASAKVVTAAASEGVREVEELSDTPGA
jgi:hypothetical protein